MYVGLRQTSKHTELDPYQNRLSIRLGKLSDDMAYCVHRESKI